MMQVKDELNRAKRMLARIRLVDGHNDLPYVIWGSEKAPCNVADFNPFIEHLETDTDVPRLISGQVGMQVFTAFVPGDVVNPNQVRAQLMTIMQDLERLGKDVFYPVRRPQDLERPMELGKIGLFQAIEGLRGVDSIEDLQAFYAAGIRLITLCHNETLPFIDSATDKPGAQPLSSFGVEVIQEMERLGLMIDLAHVSAAAQRMVLHHAQGPVMISHANARALCAHPRNAPDDVLKKIADGGGLVMATFVPSFLCEDVYQALQPLMDPFGRRRSNVPEEMFRAVINQTFTQMQRNGIDVFCDQLDYMREQIGADALGIGSDFYGGPTAPGLRDVTCFPYIFEELIRRGWRTGDLEKLSHDNFSRFWKCIYRGE